MDLVVKEAMLKFLMYGHLPNPSPEERAGLLDQMKRARAISLVQVDSLLLDKIIDHLEQE